MFAFVVERVRQRTGGIHRVILSYLLSLSYLISYYDSVGDHVLLDLYLSQENSSSGWVSAGGA